MREKKDRFIKENCFIQLEEQDIFFVSVLKIISILGFYTCSTIIRAVSSTTASTPSMPLLSASGNPLLSTPGLAAPVLSSTPGGLSAPPLLSAPVSVPPPTATVPPTLVPVRPLPATSQVGSFFLSLFTSIPPYLSLHIYIYIYIFALSPYSLFFYSLETTALVGTVMPVIWRVQLIPYYTYIYISLYLSLARALSLSHLLLLTNFFFILEGFFKARRGCKIESLSIHLKKS